jgi:hypothetical protein
MTIVGKLSNLLTTQLGADLDRVEKTSCSGWKVSLKWKATLRRWMGRSWRQMTSREEHHTPCTRFELCQHGPTDHLPTWLHQLTFRNAKYHSVDFWCELSVAFPLRFDAPVHYYTVDTSISMYVLLE